jgi:predicted nucleic-acid-binding Zn-ribbon protein
MNKPGIIFNEEYIDAFLRKAMEDKLIPKPELNYNKSLISLQESLGDSFSLLDKTHILDPIKEHFDNLKTNWNNKSLSTKISSQKCLEACLIYDKIYLHRPSSKYIDNFILDRLIDDDLVEILDLHTKKYLYHFSSECTYTEPYVFEDDSLAQDAKFLKQLALPRMKQFLKKNKNINATKFYDLIANAVTLDAPTHMQEPSLSDKYLSENVEEFLRDNSMHLDHFKVYVTHFIFQFGLHP